MNSKIASMKVTKEVPVIVRNEEINIGTSSVPYLETLLISERHTDVTTYDLSELWGILLSQNNMKKFLSSSAFMLNRRYRTDRVFTINTIQG